MSIALCIAKMRMSGRVVYSTISVCITRTGAELNCNATWLTEQKLEKLEQEWAFVMIDDLPVCLCIIGLLPYCMLSVGIVDGRWFGPRPLSALLILLMKGLLVKEQPCGEFVWPIIVDPRSAHAATAETSQSPDEKEAGGQRLRAWGLVQRRRRTRRETSRYWTRNASSSRYDY